MMTETQPQIGLNNESHRNLGGNFYLASVGSPSITLKLICMEPRQASEALKPKKVKKRCLKMRTEFLLNEKTLRESINTIDGFSQSVTEAFLNFSKKGF